MHQQASIMVVDDEPFMREVTSNALGEVWKMIGIASGEECLAAVEQALPDIILLDVEMPGIDGYETCFRLKEGVAAAVPVIFISAHDAIEDRLRGYDAGGDDYLIKPYDPTELRAKIKNLLEMHSAKCQLQEQAAYAGSTAMTAMTNMGELGALLQSLQRFNECADIPRLTDEMLAGIGLYDLMGVVQMRAPETTITRSSCGSATPLEASVIATMAGMERIVQFKSRLSITYVHVSLLISNMPVSDPDRCGRLRDHLAMLVESAEMRARAIMAQEQSNRRGAAIAQAVQSATRTLEEIDRAQRDSRAAVNLSVYELTESIERAYIGLGMTDGQETMLSEIVRKGIDGILQAHSANTDVGDKLTELVAELNKVASE